MINLSFGIDNPWAKENFKNLFDVAGDIKKNLSWEFEIIRHSHILVELSMRYTVKQDHAGLTLAAGLFGYSADFRIYDTRHWDYENNCWEVYEE